MRKSKTIAAILVTVALLMIGVACGGDEAGPQTGGLSELAPEGGVPATEEPREEPGDPSSEQVFSGGMVPRPDSVESLVAQSHIIVLGTISSVRDEIRFGAYGEDGNPTSGGEEPGTPYTDYEVRVESVLKDDGDVEDGGTLVLRMFGHLSQ